MGQKGKSRLAQRVLAWESREVLWRNRGSGGQPPSLAVAVDECVDPSGQRGEDVPQLWHPSWPCIAECSSGSDWVVGTLCLSGLLASSSLAPVFASATWCHFGRTPGSSVMGACEKVSIDRSRVGYQPPASPAAQGLSQNTAVSLNSNSMMPLDILACKTFPETQCRDKKITPHLTL